MKDSTRTAVVTTDNLHLYTRARTHPLHSTLALEEELVLGLLANSYKKRNEPGSRYEVKRHVITADTNTPNEMLPIIPVILNQAKIDIDQSQMGRMIQHFHKAMGLLANTGRSNDILTAFYIHREAHSLPPLPIFVTVSSYRRGLNAFFLTNKMADKIVGLDVHIQHQRKPTGGDLLLLQGEKLGTKWVHLTLIIPIFEHAERALYELLEHLSKAPGCLHTVKRFTVRRAIPRVQFLQTYEDQTKTSDERQLRNANKPHHSSCRISTLTPTHLDVEAWSVVALQSSMAFHSLTSICVQKIRLSDGIHILNGWIRILSTIKSLTHIKLATESDASFVSGTIDKFCSNILQSITLQSTPWSCIPTVLDAFEDCPLISTLNIRGQDDLHAYEDVDDATSGVVFTINRRFANITSLSLSVRLTFL